MRTLKPARRPSARDGVFAVAALTIVGAWRLARDRFEAHPAPSDTAFCQAGPASGARPLPNGASPALQASTQEAAALWAMWSNRSVELGRMAAALASNEPAHAAQPQRAARRSWGLGD